LWPNEFWSEWALTTLSHNRVHKYCISLSVVEIKYNIILQNWWIILLITLIFTRRWCYQIELWLIPLPAYHLMLHLFEFTHWAHVHFDARIKSWKMREEQNLRKCLNIYQFKEFFIYLPKVIVNYKTLN
jgi:hypothetical protein